MNRSLRRFCPVVSLITTAAALSSLAVASYASVGATTPFTSYEAEAGTLGGGASVVSLTGPPATQYSSPQLEASGHAYVTLTGTGQSVTWTNNTGQNVTFINVRYCIPDALNGGGITATLDLYVNGQFRQTLNMNSRQTWQYEGNNHYSNPTQNPSDGNPINFWDDTHAFISGAAVSPGSTITLQKDSSNTASFYYIDVIDVENPPAPIAQPSNSLSITSYGAVADNNPTNGSADPNAPDSSQAIQNCINAAQAQGKIVWIPQGTFYVNGTNGLVANGVTIEGAGMWYSRIYRNVPLPNSVGLGALFQVTSCHVSNFACDSDAMSRNTVDGGGGAMDTTGTNWTADSIWTQHVESGFWASGTGGTISNCRLLSIYADGANINNVSMGNTVGNGLTEKNNFVRGTGDDGIAINSVANNGSQTYSPMQNCNFLNNTVIAPWGGKCIAIYGGSGHQVQNNYGSDTARYIGLGAGRFGVNGSDLTGATITGNTIVRCGGNGYNQGQPAMHIGNGGDGQNTGTVSNVTATSNIISNSLYDGVGFSQSSNITFLSNIVQSPWRNGIVIAPPYYPAPSGSATIRANTVMYLVGGMSPFINNSSGYNATVTGNSWQPATNRKLVPGTNVSFFALANNQYVCADLNKSNPPNLWANRTAVGPWETFTVVDAGNGDIALLSQSNNKYVCADNAGASPLIANRSAVGQWETFTEIDAGSGNTALLAHANSMYVCADNAGNNPLIANRSAIGSWESYTVSVH